MVGNVAAMAERELDFDWFAPDVRAAPWTPLLRIAEATPLFWSERQHGWIITRDADVRAAYMDRRLSAERLDVYLQMLPPDAVARIATLLKYHRLSVVFLDSPSHLRIRTLFLKAFSRQAVNRIEPIVQDVISESLAEARAAGSFDFIELISERLPTRVIQRMLGIGNNQSERFYRSASDMIRALGNIPPSLPALEKGEAAVNDLNALFSPLIEARQSGAYDDILAGLVNARDAGDKLSHDELLAACHTIVEGGAETTGHMMAIALVEIARSTELAERVRADIEGASAVILELLRYPGLVKGMTRIVKESFEWHGKTLAAGDLVYLMNCAANVDPLKYDEPFRIDPDRPANQSMAFGPGLHHCIGHFLAKMELAEMMHAIFRDFDVEILSDRLSFIDSGVLRAYETLPVRFAPHAAA